MKLIRLLTLVTLTCTASVSVLAKPNHFLARCPNTPNCVSSQQNPQDKEHFIEPLKITGDHAKAWLALQTTLENQTRTEVIKVDDLNLYTETTSLIFRFVDDMHFTLDNEAGLIHVRSASRVGYSDFGVNRGRVEKLRQALQQAGVVE